ncbi:MAG: cyclic nucleotide-binding domain-containing protein [Kofleriaceae bacterium]|nr:cyclic nucleotide-binding domain-containing protein [Kofleriaceae bacterium]
MARDVRQLRVEASEATASGKYKRALAAYLELEQLEPRDAQWSKRAAETYRRLGKDKEAVAAFGRAADRYAGGGFLVQAIAVCKLILQIDPKNDDALRRIASINEQIGAGPTRAATLAEGNPDLEGNQAVEAIRSGGTDRMRPATVAPPIAISRTRTPPGVSVPRKVTPQSPVIARKITPQALASMGEYTPSRLPTPPEGGRARSSSTAPPIAIARTKSKPVQLSPNQPIESITLRENVPAAFEREESSGVYVIPLDGELEDNAGEMLELEPMRESMPVIEVEAPDEGLEVSIDDATELDIEDLEEIPLAEPRLVASAAANALASTPLFAGLSQDALGSLVEQLTLVHLGAGEVLFREGDPGDALYVIVEGEVAVQAEGPPRVEMARLGAGSFIGEVALMTDQPRSASVTATADSELLRIDRKTLADVLRSHGEVLTAVLRFVRDRLVDRWTRTSPLFRPFDQGQRAELAARFTFLEINAGSVLLHAGEKPDGLYIVLAGSFSVKRNGQLVATLGPGELIGETALLSGGVFKSEVTAVGKSLALCLPAEDFRELIMTHPHVLEVIGEAAEHSRKLQIL